MGMMMAIDMIYFFAGTISGLHMSFLRSSQPALYLQGSSSGYKALQNF